MSRNVMKSIACILGRNATPDDLEAIRHRLLEPSESSFVTHLADDGPDRLSEVAERIRDTEILVREGTGSSSRTDKKIRAH